MANIYGQPDIFERAGSWIKDKWNNLPSGQDITDAWGQAGGEGSILQGTKPNPDVGGINFTNPFSWGGNTTLGPGGYGDVNLSTQNPNIQRPIQPIEEDEFSLDEEDYGDTPGANNLLDRSQETREGYNEKEMQIPDYSESVNSMTTDLDSGHQKINDIQQKATNTNKPFRNLFQKMKQGMGKFDKDNIGSAKFDEREYLNVGQDDEMINPRYGKYMLDESGNEMKGKGIFGKEGGFMSKFGTGRGAMSGLFSGIGGAGAGEEGEGVELETPEEYMYSNPWEGVQ